MSETPVKKLGRPKSPDSEERQMRRRERQNETNKRNEREARAKHADIGEIPEVSDSARRDSCRDSLEQFILTYIKPTVTHWRDLNGYHRQLIEGVESSINNQQCIAFALPRGFAKTFVLRAGLLWTLLYHNEIHKCLAVVSATLAKTDATFRYIIQNLANESGLIFQDFPAICWPVKHLYDNAHTAYRYRGERIRGSLGKDEIVFPTLDGSPYSGITISSFSMGSGDIRGTDTIIDGKPYRTSIVFIDDPQNNQTARSKTTVINFREKLNQEIMYLAGDHPITGKKMATTIIMACTCIGVDDLAEQVLDRAVYPKYRGIKVPRMLKMPDLRAWSRYKDVRKQALLDSNPAVATEFYLSNREELDAGAECIEDHFESHQASGVQYSMDLWCDDEHSFWTEQQQNPHMAQYAASGGISVDSVTPPMIETRIVNTPRMVIPCDCTFFASFIDIGKNVFHFETTGFRERRNSAHVMDFGFWPEQGVLRIGKQSPRVKIEDAFQGCDIYQSISIALRELLYQLTIRNEYIVQESDGSLRPATPDDLHAPTMYRHEWSGDIYSRYALIGIDCSDQTYEQTIYETIIQFESDCPEWRGRIVPMYSGYAAGRLISQWDLDYKMGERQRGRIYEENEHARHGNTNCHWIENSKRNWEIRRRNNDQIRYTVFRDVNKYKERVVNSWIDGTTTVFAQTPQAVSCYAEHQSNEVATPALVGNYQYYRFKERKGANGNVDFFDCRVGTETLCDYIGNVSGIVQ
jgi:hypothetical protein